MPQKSAEPKKSMPENTSQQSRLYRSETNRIIGGVCGGLGEYFSIDPTLIRIIFVILTLFGGSGILIYLILWIVIPSETQLGPVSSDHIKQNVFEMKQRAKTFAQEIRFNKASDNSRFWWAIIIIVLGFMFLFNNLGILNIFEIKKLWPVIFIVLGLSIILKR